MKVVRIDEFLVINSYTGKKKWLAHKPARVAPNDIVVRIKGTVSYPEPIFTADFGEITVEEAEVQAQASMG